MTYDQGFTSILTLTGHCFVIIAYFRSTSRHKLNFPLFQVGLFEKWVTTRRDFNAQKKTNGRKIPHDANLRLLQFFFSSLCIKCVIGVSSCPTGFNQIKNALFMVLMKIYMLCLEMVGTKGRLYLIWRLQGPGKMENIYKQCLLAFKSSLTRAYKEWRPTMQFNAD